MDRGGRDLTQQMSNIIKLVADVKCPQRLKTEMTGLSNHGPSLAEFGNGDKRTVAGGTSPDVILAQVKEFSDLTKEMLPYYDKMVKFLKRHKL